MSIGVLGLKSGVDLGRWATEGDGGIRIDLLVIAVIVGSVPSLKTSVICRRAPRCSTPR